MSASPSRVIGLFPTPLLRAERLLTAAAVEELREHFIRAAQQSNAKSSQLAHTQILQPQADNRLRALEALLGPRIVEFGELLFGERLEWSIKEMWVNVLESGGHQALHNHANSFISGVHYERGLAPQLVDTALPFLNGAGRARSWGTVFMRCAWLCMGLPVPLVRIHYMLQPVY